MNEKNKKREKSEFSGQKSDKDKKSVNPDEIKEHFIDESYRMDDNSNYSKIALNESDNVDDRLIPGIGINK